MEFGSNHIHMVAGDYTEELIEFCRQAGIAHQGMALEAGSPSRYHRGVNWTVNLSCGMMGHNEGREGFVPMAEAEPAKQSPRLNRFTGECDHDARVSGDEYYIA